MRGRTPRWRCVALGACALVALASLACAVVWPSIFDSVLSYQMTLTPTSRAYREWVTPSIPLYFDIYMFNWTNAAKFPDEKPNLEQLGPYRFREYRRHVNISWYPHNSSVAYRTFRSWHFDPTSNGSLSDNITTLNVLAASAIYRSRDWGFIRQKGLSMGLAMFGQHMSVSKLARELLFDGYEDPLLDLAKSLPASTTGGAPPVDKFGWFYTRNNSLDTDGYVEISTGALSGTLPGQILRWNHQDHLQYYDGECSKLSGSMGEFMPRDLSARSRLTMFVPDLCRPLHMHYADSGQLAGLQYLKYTVTERSFDNSSIYTSNTCFCNGDCAWPGVMNVSACRYGSPAFVSLPHFLHSDKELRDHVTGMQPDPEKHTFFISVESKLGVPLEVAARFQLNILVEPSENIALYQNVPRMLFPILWFEQHVVMDDKIASELRMVRAISDWGGTVCACVALTLAILVIIATCYIRRSRYSSPHDLTMTYDKPKDEAEFKLNPM